MTITATAAAGVAPHFDPAFPFPSPSPFPFPFPDRMAVGEIADGLCAVVCESLRRRDQREKARRYVRGLLATPGRKSFRNMAGDIGGTATEQSLHHFISGSTWAWEPIRAALAGYLEATAPAPLTAWVAQPMAIPRSGARSVGVEHRFDPHQGQMFRGQQAFGTWFTSPGVVTPVGWELLLPGSPYEESAVGAVLDTVRGSGLAPRPVVLDIRGIGTRCTMNRFAEAGVPVVARVGGSPTAAVSPVRAEARAEARFVVRDPALPGFGGGARGPVEILRSVKGLGAPVEWTDAGGVARSSWAVGVRVMMPDPAVARRRELLLVGEWGVSGRLVAMWVTDLVRVPVGVVVRLTKAGRRVEAVACGSGRDVGLRDFSGRGLGGWHRHVTLGSVAHAAVALAGRERGPR
ncbi:MULTISPECIES: transposase [unclassified Streptomyces]|uniref:IS701 family transposase n=1 Tax=unclassified Streptomyces TaxID=2593676 RepID=UPI002252A50E|nr:transposase [Streptomyces sp. NBC_01551]MCX4527102.1 transposase [Streptomyces sp. NBC_01551]